MSIFPFKATTREAGNRVRHLVLSGELDMAALPALLPYRLTDGRAEFDCLVVDMSGLTFLDSTGVHFLLDLHARSEREGWTLRVVPGPPRVQRVLEITGLTDIVPWAGAAVESPGSHRHSAAA